jgi:hypothetical protein
MVQALTIHARTLRALILLPIVLQFLSLSQRLRLRKNIAGQ